MSLVRCQFLSNSFRPGPEGIFLDGKGILPNIAYDWQNMSMYVADHVYHYCEIADVDYRPEFKERLWRSTACELWTSQTNNGRSLCGVPDEG